MEEAERLCDRLVIMDEGQIVTDGRPPDLVREHVGREVLELRLDEGAMRSGSSARSTAGSRDTNSPSAR